MIILFTGCDDNPTGGEPRPIPPIAHKDPDWSPDGRYIIYYNKGITNMDSDYGYLTNSTKAGLYLVDLTNSNTKQLIAGRDFFEPTFSPDGQWIVFVFNDKLHLLHISGDSLREIETSYGCYDPAWSSDGKWIAFKALVPPNNYLEEWRGILYKIRPDGTEETAFIVGGQPVQGNYANWFQGDDFLLFMSTNWEKPGLFTLNLIDSTFEWLFNPLHSAGYPNLSPDGKKIVFTHDYTLCKLYLSNPQPIPITKELKQGIARWSPDGKKIVYCAPDKEFTWKGAGVLWTMNEDGSGKRQLTFLDDVDDQR
ncbi:DPP IV N-terminal domain-containing protein [bacterium]|nr:DPP IV N-terminal domain-containing protein [bacterium]